MITSQPTKSWSRFILNKSEKKLTVPVQPSLSTNKRASDSDFRPRNSSFCKTSESVAKPSLEKERQKQMFASTIHTTPPK
mmetsp:Transcript_34644/g.40099  ORF Transcript_34644/g.40099 Transcript_34644/m.40099 type:complete len:80 (+) Transcript_34644:112-351(+)